jgi:membrane protease YdiL (CAAX protease family)
MSALGVSSLVFGVAHIGYGGVNTPVYQPGMAVKSSAAGVLLGWVFWRRGLPYSIVCHSTANAIHLVLMPLLF